MPATEKSPRGDWSLADWLHYQERLHPNAIALGLERVQNVAQRLGLIGTNATTLTVGGTNGKGSSATLASEIYRAAGYCTGLYTSPHLFDYNERIVIDGVPASDRQLCAAFRAIEQARADILLTYFEFGTLAALWLFREARVDVQVLEVGLGGRLDAVNIVDADCALITNIGLDHLDWLGDTHEQIGFEKAGIFRSGKPAIVVQLEPPASLLRIAAEKGAELHRYGHDFNFTVDEAGDRWVWTGLDRISDGQAPAKSIYTDLPMPGLRGSIQLTNAAGVIAAVEALQPIRPVSANAIRSALPRLQLAGRYQRVGQVVLDVAHNAEAAEILADNLRQDRLAGTVILVLGMFNDKPVEGVCGALTGVVKCAFFGSLPPPRGLDAEQLRLRAIQSGITGIAAGDIAAAYRAARAAATDNDVILVCGSFLTVAAVARILDE